MVDINIYELRILCREYYTLVDERADIKKKISACLRLFFPGYEDVFSDTTGNSSLAILSAYPSPTTIISAPADEVIFLLKVTSRKGLGWAKTAYSRCS